MTVANGVEWRRVVASVGGSLGKHFTFKFQWDFATNSPPNLKDAYINVIALSPFQIRAGRFVQPLGLESYASTADLTFLEPGLTSAFLQPNMKSAMLHGEMPGHKTRWAFAVIKPEDKFGGAVTDTVGFSARFASALNPWGEGTLLHVAGDYNRRFVDETIRIQERPESHLAPAFVDTGDIAADSASAGIVEAALVHGPFSMQGEYSLSTVDAISGPTPVFHAFYVYGSYFLTGETRGYDRPSATLVRPQPKRFLTDGSHGLGALEIAFRFSGLDLNDKDVRGGKLVDFTAALNWYPTYDTRVMFNVIRAAREGADVVWIAQVRVQLAY